MKQAPAELLSNLALFTGTEQYYRLLPTFVVTDGLKYLMDEADCYWLAQLYASHVVSMDGEENPFTVLKLVRQDNGAVAKIEDGNGRVLASQTVEYTDFPLDQYSLYACWGGEFWVGMLTSEY